MEKDVGIEDLLGKWKLIFLFLVSLTLRFYHLTFQSLWGDEFITQKIASGKSPLSFLSEYWKAPDFHPPGYYLLMNVIGQVAPLNDWTLRFPSALASALTTIVIANVGAQFFSEEVGLIAASLALDSHTSAQAILYIKKL